MAYAALVVSLMCKHLASKCENEHQARRVQQCLETLAYVYFVMNRSLQPNDTPLFFDLVSCVKYPSTFNGLFLQQWFLIRIGVGSHDMYRLLINKESVFAVLAGSFNSVFAFICLLYYSDQQFVHSAVSILLQID